MAIDHARQRLHQRDELRLPQRLPRDFLRAATEVQDAYQETNSETVKDLTFRTLEALLNEPWMNPNIDLALDHIAEALEVNVIPIEPDVTGHLKFAQRMLQP